MGYQYFPKNTPNLPKGEQGTKPILSHLCYLYWFKITPVAIPETKVHRVSTDEGGKEGAPPYCCCPGCQHRHCQALGLRVNSLTN